ncbi:hypothetical protein PMSD_06055 [Paenibacillus macquariensis subsp. defensor]|nr:hypothetical protein PMSD_21905 [Paenibacillus macquariensis subsp. defensor]OAB38577.1 hypothetical protein PMSD_06055 [Paenibacillus macquariensis subsp. defensor]
MKKWQLYILLILLLIKLVDIVVYKEFTIWNITYTCLMMIILTFWMVTYRMKLKKKRENEL